MDLVQSLIEELRFHNPCNVAKIRQKRTKKTVFFSREELSRYFGPFFISTTRNHGIDVIREETKDVNGQSILGIPLF